MSNKFSRIVCGFLSVVMCICSTVHVTNVSAADVEIIPEFEDAIEVTALSVALKRGDGSFAEINKWTHVNNGDTLSLDFAWEALGNEQPPLTFVYDLSDALQNISLGSEQVIETADATYRIVGQTLYIDVEKGKSGRSGTCRLEGTVNLNNAEVDEQGITELKFLDKIMEAYAPSKVTGVSVQKSANDFVSENGVFYQYFTVKVANNSAENSVSGAKITDTFAKDIGESLFADSNLIDYTITKSDSSVFYGPSTVITGTEISLPELPAGDYVNVTYKVQVDKEKALNLKNGENIATVEYNKDGNLTTAIGYAKANPGVPYVSKNGNLDPVNKDKITYTIIVNPGTLVANTSDFVVLDTPAGIAPGLIADAIGGSVEVEGNSVKIPVSEMTPENGGYKLEYVVELPDNLKNQIISKDVNNELEVTFDDQYTYTDHASVHIPASGSALINKSVDGVDYETGIIDWKVELFIPNDISATNTLQTFQLADWLNGHLDGSIGEEGKSYFDEKGATESVDKADAVLSGITVSTNGVDFVPLNDTIAVSTNKWNTNKESIDYIKFTDQFLDDNAGKTITLKYSSKMDTSAENYKNLTYQNTAKLNYKFSEESSSPEIQSKAYVSPSINVKKGTGSPENNNYTRKNVKKWVIRLNTIKYDFSENEVITVTDILPEGYEIIDGSEGFAIEKWEVSGRNTSYDPYISYTSSMVNGRQKLEFTVTLTADMAAKMSLSTGEEGKQYLAVVFDACMTDDYYEEFNLNNSTGEPVDITNEATVTIDNKEYDVKHTTQVTPVLPDGLLEKTVVSQNKNANTFDADYQIVVNENADNLIDGDGEDILTLTDTLGTWLELVENSVQVTPPAESVSYDKASRKLTLTLKDETPYTVTYSVVGDCAKFEMVYGDGTGVKNEYAEEMYSNTVTLSGQDISSFNTSVMLDESTYKTDATYQYNVLLSGEKTWVGPVALIPSKVTIELKETKTSPSGVVTVTPSVRQLDVTSTDGTWTYTIEGLTSKDVEGNRYSYEIVEVRVGGDDIEDSGYSVTYTDKGTNNTNDGEELTINFRNDFTADDTEVGKLQITKDWVHDGNTGSLPTSAEVKVYAVGTNTPVRTGTVVAGTPLVFSNLPLYDYSRNADTDKLVRTARKYYVVETEVSGYTTKYSVNSAVAAETCSEFELSDVTTSEVTVTNTYNGTPAPARGSISVTKVWDDENNADQIRPASVEFTLTYNDGESDKSATISYPDQTEFTGLPVYKTGGASELVEYTLTESAVSGYTTVYRVNSGENLADCVFNITADATTAIKVTNTHEVKHQEYGSISATKAWSDNNNAENLRPASVTFILKADGTEVDRKNVTDTVAFTNLPVYRENGAVVTDEKIVYTIEEIALEGYETSYIGNNVELTNNTESVITVTNTLNYTIEKGSISVEKVWQDAGGNTVDTIDDSVTVILYADDVQIDTATVTSATPAQFTDLRLYKYNRANDGSITKTAISYRISETAISGYTTTYKLNGAVLNGGFALTDGTKTVTVTNKKDAADQKYGSIAVNKAWVDNDDARGLRPESITFILSSDDGVADRTATIVSPDVSVSFDSLPVYKVESGIVTAEKVTYVITEALIDGYTVSYTGNTGIQLEDGGTESVSVTNTLDHTPETGSITVIKAWQDENGVDIAPYSDILITLSDNDNSTSDITGTINTNSSSVTFDNLPVYQSYERNANGDITGVNPITYYVTETTVPGYEAIYSVTPATGLDLVSSHAGTVTITNKKLPAEVGSIKVTKNWVDTNNTIALPHPDITIVLKADGVQIDTADITANQSVTSFENFPVYKNDGITRIVYSIEEIAVAGYETSYAGNNVTLTNNTESNIVVTNTFNYAIEKGNIKVTKKWQDSNGDPVSAASSIIVQVANSANGTILSESISIGGSESVSFNDLPLYTYEREANGSITKTPISYTVTETNAPSGYTVTYTLDGAVHNGDFTLTANNTREVIIRNKKIAEVTTTSATTTSTTPEESVETTTTTTVPGSSATTTTTTTTVPESSATTTTTTTTVPGSSATTTTTTTTVPGSSATTTTTTTTTTTSNNAGGAEPGIPQTSTSSSETTTRITTSIVTHGQNPVRTTTTTTAAEVTTTAKTTENVTEEKPETTTTVVEDTDTTTPADSDYEEDEEMSDEDTLVDDSIGNDSDFVTDVEENPHTYLPINFGYTLTFAFGVYAFFPRKKKKN